MTEEQPTNNQASLGGSASLMRENEDEAGMVESRDYFRQLVQQEVDSGIPADRIVLGGFSQGGAVALFSGLTSLVKLAGIIGMSTYLPLTLKLESTYLPKAPAINVNAQTPILMCHGTVDPVLPFQLGRLSKEHLLKLGYPVEWKEYQMPHTAVPEEGRRGVVAFFMILETKQKRKEGKKEERRGEEKGTTQGRQNSNGRTRGTMKSSVESHKYG